MKAAQDTGHSGPQIVENYRAFEPPESLRTLIKELLESVPPNYLAGLKTIVLTNQSALTRNQRRQKIWSRSRKTRLATARGAYYAATRSSPATIWLYVDNILSSSPPWILRTPILHYYPFASVLYHEIGHHIHAVHKPVYEGKENIAEDWSRKLFRLFLRDRYWYLVLAFYPLWILVKGSAKLIKLLSKTRR